MPVLEKHDLMIGEYYQSHYGIGFNYQSLQQALANVLSARGEGAAFSGLDDKINSSFLLEIMTKMLSPEDTFSQAHEIGHLYSLTLLRPATTQLKATWSAIEDLLQKATTETGDGFWDKFIKLNNKLNRDFPDQADFPGHGPF
jgi:hypothetical protein